ncbi:MmgE/PrpD family protein [Nocardioides caldifontis]|uniref:MmgE/PrpD family protein n=1 Tax=Nocardioides caldifontis TaxID=2588938 RepID=UPI0011DFA8FC|nr:MmgE/PrpD family protein [Nocardioides caldifontis]
MTQRADLPVERWQQWRARLTTRISDVDPTALLADGPVRRKAALVVVDDLAAMVAGHAHPEIRTLVDGAVARGGAAEASLLSGVRVAREQAAAINAAAAAWDELDEGYRPATCHGGLYTVPAVTAEAEATGRSVAEVLSATVVGYEVVTAFARVLPPPRPLVLHPHATLSPIGAAAGLTWLRTRDAEAVLRAADVAATMSMAGPFGHAVTGAQVRNGWPAAGAVLGFMAADFAVAGLGGEPSSAWDTFATGYGHQISDGELDRAFDSWAILDGYHKVYAACQYTHSALEASLELSTRALAGRSTDEVDEVVVATHPLAYPLDNRAPDTALAGKFSLPHVVAAVLSTGRTDPSVFDAPLLDEPALARVRERVRLEPFEPLPAAPHDRPARVTLRLADGTTHEATCLSAVGGPDRPLDESQVLDKVAALTSTAAPGFEQVARSLVLEPAVPTSGWGELLTEALR